MKQKQRQHWDAVAPGWAAWLDWTERNFRLLTAWLGEAAGWVPGARVLDVACGAGYPALAAAAAVRPAGRVVASDLSPEMVAVTSRRAREAGLDNVVCVQADAEALNFDTASFDAVTNAYGLMFCPDPSRAVGEAHRVLRPGGRVALVTWDEPAKSPFFTVAREVAAEFLSLPAPGPEEPGPFRLASPPRVEALLLGAGFTEVRVDSFAMRFEFESAADYAQIFTDYAWKARVAALGAADAERFRRAVAAACEPHLDAGRLSLVATSLRARGRKD